MIVGLVNVLLEIVLAAESYHDPIAWILWLAQVSFLQHHEGAESISGTRPHRQEVICGGGMGIRCRVSRARGSGVSDRASRTCAARIPDGSCRARNALRASLSDAPR